MYVCMYVWKFGETIRVCTVVHMVRSLEHIVDTVKAILSLSDLVFFSCFALHYWCVQVFSVRMDCKPLFEHFLSLFLLFRLRSPLQFNIEIILHNQERMLCSSETFLFNGKFAKCIRAH